MAVRSRSERSPRDTYLAHLETMAIDPATLSVDERGTIAAPQGSLVGIDDLPRVRLDGEGAELRLEEEVARGGMGAIHLATQLALQRRVAVKRPVGASGQARSGLLGEALVTGALQHPNVVPVHALGRDDEGEPVLVMRFIEGTRWSERIEPLFPEARGGEDDPVDEQLRILIQVCNAVELAHAMRIVHLDLKPDNVMLGQYGEVYVLDWGLAAATDDRAPARLRLASDIRHVAGTPAYMAPEMAAGEGELIGVCSDVYLLGAILHELITGSAPHEAERVIDALASSFTSDEIDFDEDVPRELAEICKRAMRFAPEARYPDVKSFREDLLAFLRHRSSARATQDALSRIGALRELDEDDLHDELVAEARFGLRQALQEWPDNPEARDGLRALVLVNLDWHLAREDVRGAAAALKDLPSPDDKLAARVDKLAAEMRAREDAKDEELRELRAMAHEGRLHRGPAIMRNVTILALALALPITVMTTLRVVYGRKAGYAEALALTCFVTVVMMALQRGRAEVATVMERKMSRAVLIGLSSIAFVLALCWAAGVSLTVALALALVPAAALLSMGGILVEPGFAVGVIPLVVGSVLILAYPPLRGPFFAAATGLAFVLGGRAWGRSKVEQMNGDDEPISRE